MKRNDKMTFVIVCIFAAVLAFFVSKSIFKASAHNATAPNIQVIDSNMPDVKHETSYNTIFYSGALDPTQPVQIGNSSNKQPF